LPWSTLRHGMAELAIIGANAATIKGMAALQISDTV
jgi:hypothetical protein